MRDVLRRFWQSEEGSSTLEFVILFPFVFGLVLGSIELGLLLTRQAMLDRGLDLAVRQVRLGVVADATPDRLRDMICAGAGLIPDCPNQIRLEMVPVDPRNWARLPAKVDCVDRSRPARPARAFRNGGSNQLMMLRACVLVDPYFPPNILGFPSVMAGARRGFALVSASAFVIEPS